MDSYNIAFRTDANQTIGSGHLKRCLVIADEFTRLFNVRISFFCNVLNKALADEIESNNFKLIHLQDDSEQLVSALKVENIQLLITDTDKPIYYDTDFQSKIIENQIKLVTITFFNEGRFLSHIIHNQNVRAKGLVYNTAAYTKNLLGLAYVILDKQFRIENKKLNRSSKADGLSVLISFGGADSNGMSAIVVDELSKLSIIKSVTVVVGALFNDHLALSASAEKCSFSVEIIQNTTKMADLMKMSDVAITSGGLTSWELAALNVNNIIMPTSKREQITADYLSKHHDIMCLQDPTQLADSLTTIYDKQMFHNPLHTIIDKNGVTKFCNECVKSINEDE